MPSVISCLLPGSQVDRAATGLWGAAERLAAAFDTKHVVVAVGVSETVLETAARHADQVVAVAHGEYQPEPCLAVLRAVCSEARPGLILLGQDTFCQELAPRLAYRLRGCSIGDAQQLEVREGRLHVTRSVYGGKAIAVVRANVEPAVVWLRARAFAEQPDRSEACSVESRELPMTGHPGARIIGRLPDKESGVRLEEARVIVSGGRGLGGPEPFEELRELARVMGAELAASRAACDSGWVPPSLQVGQTGKKVSPELYLAIAISGASQHLMGIADAKVVAGINTDPDAPIFRRCQFGLVADWKDVVAPLRECIAEMV